MYFVKDDVVISGVGGYFPKALNIREFSERLLNNEMLMTSRWKAGERGVTNVIGTVPTEFFDNAYFGIHRQQCTFMDPMHRLILERSYEALIDAGVNPAEVRGRRIGCFMASSVGENDNLFLESVVSGFGVTGHSRAMMPNRVSYWLDIKGPSVAYDSNWVGGIEVLKLAYEAVKTGQCEACLVGCANLALNSEFQWLYADMNLLSPDGMTNSFDASAAGYGRSDGVVVMYIQRSGEARRNYATILASGTTFDGNRPGTLLEINSNNLAEFIEEVYEKTDVDPSEVQYVEAYGCALKETDKREVEALEQAYCKNRTSPLLIGCVKANSGHSEATAALFAVAKVLIAMESGVIPATINYQNPNPEILPLVNGTVQVVTENLKWEPKYAAVNSIGLDSYYGHILFKANQKKKVVKHSEEDIPRLALASTRTEAGIKEILETIKSQPTLDHEYISLIQNVYAKPILGHLYRGYSILGAGAPKEESDYHSGNKRQTWFVYSGMGSQWPGMLNDFMKIEVFANAIHKCCDILRPKGVDLMHIISTKDKTIFDNILHSFVGIAAIQIALTDCLKAVGIVPDGIIGHSVGELGCAYADDCITAEQMILCAYSRGLASIETKLIKGMMAAIGLGYDQIKNKVPETIEVACHNGPDSCTISGPTEDMEKFVKELQDQGVFARLVNVANIAYHSRYIKPAAPRLLEYLKKILPEPKPRSEKWICTSSLEENWDSELCKLCSAEYHTNNLLSSVYFEEGLKHIPKDSVLIEIAPHGLLQAILKRSLKPGCTNVPLTHRGSASGIEFLLTSLGKLYLAGLNVDILKLYPKIEYPVSRGTASLADLAKWEHGEAWRTGLEEKLKSLFGVRDFQVTLNSEEFRDCIGHQIDDKIILPCSSYLNIIADVVSHISAGHKEYIFENLHFKRVLAIPRIGSVPLHAMIQKGSGEFEILAGTNVIITGRLTFPQANDKYMMDPVEIDESEERILLSANDVYSEFYHRGYKYSGHYKTIKNLTLTERGSVGVVQWNNKWTDLIEAMLQQHLLHDGERDQDIVLPKNILKIIINQEMLPTEPKEVKSSYDIYTGVITCEGVQIVGIKPIPIPKDPTPISFDSLEFTPFEMQKISKIEIGINAALHLTLENFEEKMFTSLDVTELKTTTSFFDNIKNVCSQYPKLHCEISSVEDVKSIVLQDSSPQLIISDEVITEELAKLISSSSAFILARTSKFALNHPDLATLFQFIFNGQSYTVLRRARKVAPITVSAVGDTLSVKDFTKSSHSWVNELDAATELAETKRTHVYLIASVIPTEGINNFVEELRSSSQKLSTVHVLFILDKKANITDQQLKTIFRLDLSLTIFQNNAWGTLIPVPLKLIENIQNNLNITSNAIESKIIHYIGVNLKDETLLTDAQKKNELGNLDYSGVTVSGQKIMGLAQLDKYGCKFVADPVLSWSVPEGWSLEDAATLPHAYSSAYYCLCIKASLKEGEVVLIHTGCSAIGLAAISIATSFNCRIFTTVSTESQKAYLKQQFPGLDEEDILSSDDAGFEPSLLLATNGKGAHVIINNLSGGLLQSSVSCLAEYGRMIQIGKYDVEENNSFGMSVFLKNTSFSVVNLENIVIAAKDVKEELQSLIQEGLKSKVVRPIPKKIVEHQNVSEMLNILSSPDNIGKVVMKVNNNLSLNKLYLHNPSQFICDAKNSYLIYGGSAEYWVDITEWLILRGARKIVVCSDSKPQQTHLNRRLTLLQTHFNTEIIYAPPKAHTKEGAAELVSEVYALGSIHCAFVLPSKTNNSRVSSSKSVQYLDKALRTAAPKTLFINLLSNASGIVQSRSELGYPTFDIQWHKDLEFSDAIAGLDDILVLKAKTLLIKNDRISDSTQETAQALFKKLTHMLPTSLETFIDNILDAPTEPELVQITTLGPTEMRELSPIFVIPGLSSHKELDEMAFELIYPTFWANLPSKPMPLKDLAQSLAEQILKVWPKGAYNIIGYSWGGALMVEVARILEKHGASLHLYFVDAAPETIQSAIKHLGEESKNIETNLLTRVLKLNDIDIVKKLTQSSSWDDRLKIALDAYDGEISDPEVLKEGLFTLKTHLTNLLEYKPTDHLVSGQIHLIRPTGASQYDNCGLVQYCKQTPKITIVSGDHLSILTNDATSEYINENQTLV